MTGSPILTIGRRSLLSASAEERLYLSDLLNRPACQRPSPASTPFEARSQSASLALVAEPPPAYFQAAQGAGGDRLVKHLRADADQAGRHPPPTPPAVGPPRKFRLGLDCSSCFVLHCANTQGRWGLPGEQKKWTDSARAWPRLANRRCRSHLEAERLAWQSSFANLESRSTPKGNPPRVILSRRWYKCFCNKYCNKSPPRFGRQVLII